MEDEGVFGNAKFSQMARELKGRVPEKRYKHCKRVSKTAVKMARAYGCDEAKARMAGLLHDWDKGLSDVELRARVEEFNIDIDPFVVEHMPWMLHGPTAAAALEHEYPEFGAEVFQAIRRHTSGACGMSDLDMIIYVADLVEPGRDGKHAVRVRNLVGKERLEIVYFEAFRSVLQYLVRSNRLLFPGTSEIWNHLIRGIDRETPGRLRRR